jgi:hypothetical protein
MRVKEDMRICMISCLDGAIMGEMTRVLKTVFPFRQSPLWRLKKQTILY